jgi:hypothetical protein
MSSAVAASKNHEDVRGTRTFITKKPRNAKELRDMLGVRGAFGRTLNDLRKQGR